VAPAWDQDEADPFAELDSWLEVEEGLPFAHGRDVEGPPSWDEDPWLDPP